MKKTIIAFFLVFLAMGTRAQEETPLYDHDNVPNYKMAANEEKSTIRPDGVLVIEGVQKPTITVYPHPAGKANGTAVIICPGGGYRILAAGHEGADVAKEFNKWGVTAFVLKYRIPSDKWMIDKSIGPLQDAQRAIQWVRENAGRWHIDTSRIGIMGFSAGGHLASSAATHFQKNYIDNAAHTNLRPDFQILLYPVISFADSICHMGSRENLIGKDPSDAMIREYSGELLVTAASPPAFMVHAADDKVVNPLNSIFYYQALLKNKVPAELHIYERGGHGFGMNNKTTQDKWMERLYHWMQARGLMENQK